MAAPAKDTIYVDIDDEITSVIEKVRDSSGKIVALVLPKRAAVFQSIVNMRLLKRIADDVNKHVVLVTSESSLMPLAGAAGLYVAKTPQSKPLIPEAPAINDQTVSVDDMDDTTIEPEEALLDRTASVGELASPKSSNNETETIEIGEDDATPPLDATTPKLTKSSKGVNRRLRVPDFNKFRIRLFAVILLMVLLGVGWVFAFIVLPKAKITIRTNDTSINSSITIVGSLDAKTADVGKLTVPASKKEYKKADSQKVAATGKKDVGTKAGGTVTLSLNDCSQPQVVVPAGTAVSAGDKSFITQVEATLTRVQFGSQCRNEDFKEVSTASVKVVAQSAGDQYNLSARAYTVAGAGNVSGYGSSMTGGTSKLVTVVSQADIDGAKQKIIEANDSNSVQAVSGLLKSDGCIPLTETLKSSDPLVTASPNVDSEANEVTVNVSVTYTMIGAKEDGVKQVLEADISKQIDTQKQKILDNGLGKATIKMSDRLANGDPKFSLQSTALAGVQQDVNEIKKVVSGKKRGEIQSLLSKRPGVKDVTVEYSPAWVFKAPSSPNKITVIFQQNDGSTSSGQ